MSAPAIRLGRLALAAALVAMLAGLGAASAFAGRRATAHRTAIPRARALAPLTLGFSAGADVALASGNAATQAFWVPRAHAERAQMVRLDVLWSSVAPATPPVGFDASNPADPAYNWTAVDEQVRELAAAGFQTLITVQSAPAWAEGADAPKGTLPGTWEPNATDLAQFAHAIATRYSGRFPDPLNPGRPLPRVRYWQAWDEPNLPEYLAPQWSHSPGSGYQPVSPNLYRTMENGFYSAVKAVNRSNFVVLAGLAPYGDNPGTAPLDRMRPVEFERALLCVTQRLTLAPGCGGHTFFDAIDSHLYGIYGPNWNAFYADDVAIPDVYKLVQVLHAAERLHTAMPAGAKATWVTEISWSTKPPNPKAVPIQTEARWQEQAFYNLWQQGVNTVLWWQLVDSPPIPNYEDTYQGGVYYLNGDPKPSATSFLFPFLTRRTNYQTVIAWSRSPASGVLSIQELAFGRWHTVTRVRVSANEVFEVPLHLILKRKLRARIGRYASLPWTQAG